MSKILNFDFNKLSHGYHHADSKTEQKIVDELLPQISFTEDAQNSVINLAGNLINIIRNDKEFGIEQFMQQFSLSTEEGVAVMCLAEGLLRVPDKFVAQELAVDKLSDKQWQDYLTKSGSFKGILASTGLYISGKFADIAAADNILAKLVARVGTPMFILSIKQAIKFLGQEFVFGTNVTEALKNTKNYSDYNFAFDLLGESARTMEQAEKYYEHYINAITEIANSYSNIQDCESKNGKKNQNEIYNQQNLSVKFTALYPRFELRKIEDIDKYLLPKLVELVKKARQAGITITFDAEEARRLDIYMWTFTQLITHPELKDFGGIGCVVQAYQTRAAYVIDYVIELSKQTGKKIPLRLVKGAYWDSEIKYAQENGLANYPVFTTKEHTDANYIACARKIFENDQYIFPQFATHNALTAATIIQLANGKEFEFQKLHGMGKVLHFELVKNYPVRIYAPIGHMHDLLAYLMRRMLENGANACFVNQVNNKDFDLEQLAYDLHDHIKNGVRQINKITLPKDIYPYRENPIGYDLGQKEDYDHVHSRVSAFFGTSYKIGSIISGNEMITDQKTDRYCPADFAEKIAEISYAGEKEMINALELAHDAFDVWASKPVADRAKILRQIADLYEENKFQLYALLIKEAGKSIQDAIAEVIEAIDFCRYYAIRAELICTPKEMPSATGERNILTMHPRGVFLCISPWNFPLAIFTGQIVTNLVCGNSVIAKPADQTPVIANFAIKLMHLAGVPKDVLQFIIASGADVGKSLLPSEKIAGVVFTGSTATARTINMTLAAREGAIVPFIAETGGQNAMIVDSSALLEQATDDILTSAFYSAGQRCSALRIVYIQEEIYAPLIDMIKKAMELLAVGDTSDFARDIGPVIDKKAATNLREHIQDMVAKGFKLIAAHPSFDFDDSVNGSFFYPHILEVNSINDIPDEKFGPILHVAKYKSQDLDNILQEINNCGFGLTFGIHSRVEKKIDYIKSKIKVGNIYANRSMVGAKVESQPFGGENKSGTGFKAGGPHYLLRFLTERTTTINLTAIGGNVDLLRS